MKNLNTILDFVRYATSEFNLKKVHLGQGCEHYLDEAIYLISSYLNFPFENTDYFLNAHLTEHEKNQLFSLIKKRLDGTPTAYLTNKAYLAGFQFFVNENTIIPRSFIAELLTEYLSPWVENANAPMAILDLCTGQGSLAIIAAHYFAQSQVDALDISKDALRVAAQNVAEYALENRIHLVHSNAFEKINQKKYDVILCNPPYVNADSMSHLPLEFQAEPVLALSGGQDGLDFVRILIQQAKTHLKENGILIVEIGHNRAVLEKTFPSLPFVWLETSAGCDYVFLLNAFDL